MAAELKHIQPDRKVTLIHSRPKLLSSESLPDEVKDRALSLLHEVGVETIMGTRVTNIEETKGSPSSVLSLSDGRQITTSMVINAISHFVPTSSYLPASILDDKGYVKIKPTYVVYLYISLGQSPLFSSRDKADPINQLISLEFIDTVPNAYYHHAAGDIASWAGIKRCGAAMNHGHYTAANIHQKMLKELDHSGTTVPKFLEIAADVPPCIGLAVGKKAVAYNPISGMDSGEEVTKVYFEDDLGFKSMYSFPRPRYRSFLLVWVEKEDMVLT